MSIYCVLRSIDKKNYHVKTELFMGGKLAHSSNKLSTQT